MLREILYHLKWRRTYNRTKRILSYRANNRLTIALYTMGALRRV